MPERAMKEMAAAVKRPRQSPEPHPHTHVRAPGPVWDPPALGAPPALLAVQRAAGNRAVMRMLDARRPGGPLAGPVPAIQALRDDELHEPSDEAIRAAAAEGVRTPSTTLPHLDRIQASFGRHSIAHIQAHIGPEAARASRAMNALAYASGNHVVFGATPDLRIAAHEAAHIVQQQAGVQLSGGIGRAGDPYERHADAVADAVVAASRAEGLLARLGPSPTTAGADSIVDTPRIATGSASTRQPSAVQRAPREIPEHLSNLLKSSEAEPDEQNWVLEFRNVAFPGKRRSIAEFMLEMVLVRGGMPFDELALYVSAMKGLENEDYNRRFMKIKDLRMAALEAFLDPQSAYRNKIAEVLSDKRANGGLQKVSTEDYQFIIQYFTPDAQPEGRSTNKSTLEVATINPDDLTGASGLSITGRPAFEEDAVNLPGMRKGYHRRHIVAWHTLRAATSNIINYALKMGYSDDVIKLFKNFLDAVKIEYAKDAQLPELVKATLARINSSVRNLWPGGGYQNSLINIYSGILREWAKAVENMNLKQLVEWYETDGSIMRKIEKRSTEKDLNAGKYQTALLPVAEYLESSIRGMIDEGKRAARVKNRLDALEENERGELIQLRDGSFSNVDPTDCEDNRVAKILLSMALTVQVQSEVEVMTESEYTDGSAKEALKAFSTSIAAGDEWNEAIQVLAAAAFGEDDMEKDTAVARLNSVRDATSEFPTATLYLPERVASAGMRMADLLHRAADNFEVDFPFLGATDAMARSQINGSPHITEFLRYVDYLLSKADGNVDGKVEDHLLIYSDTLLFFGRAT